jgi:hypothetical protein
MDIIRFLFFPGLLFVTACGGLLLLLEGWLRAAFYGGRGFSLRAFAGGRAEAERWSPGELSSAALSLAAMGVAGVLLVGVKGDLLVLLLLFSAVEVLPFPILLAQGNEGAPYIPLLFRAAFPRLAALACIVVSVSLRFPAEFSPGLEGLRGEGAFGAVQLWNGTGFAFILASLVCSAIAFLLVLMGRPSCGNPGAGEGFELPGFYSLAAEGSHRAVSLFLFIVLFLGYPWEGWTALLLWSAAALGTAASAAVLRAWAEGRGRAFIRRLQAAALLLALLSIAFAFTAVA